MRKPVCGMALAVLVRLCAFGGPSAPTDYVDPFIGCAFNGHTFCAAAYPAGFVQAGPDTGNRWWDYCGGFRFEDERIIGFSQTHVSGAGDAEMGDVMIMPFVGSFDLTRTNWASAYERETFVAQPGYCGVTLTDNGVRVESTVTQRAGIYRLNFTGDGTRHVLLDLSYAITHPVVFRIVDCELSWDSSCELRGRIRRHSYCDRECAFAVRFSRPVVRRTELPRVERAEKAPRLVLDFDLRDGEPLMMKFGLSSVDTDGARNNLDSEIPDWDFERTRTDARTAWDRMLSRMTAEGPDDRLKSFYTALYHLFLQPYDMSDADGRFRRADGSVGRVPGHPFYTMFSCWDTFRAVHPLYTLIAPERVDAFCESLVDHWRTRGFLPQNWVIWGVDTQSMIATHSVPILADACLKGFSGPRGGWAEAWKAVSDTLGNIHPQRRKEDWDLMGKYGYLPYDKVRGESVSRTLENCYDDACAARMALRLGHDAEAERFRRRSLGWTNLLDRATGFMRGRDSNGKWREPFDPRRAGVGPEGGRNDFTEGNSWQYSWHVMQDPERLIALHGGKGAFVRKLDGLFRAPERRPGDPVVWDMTGLIGMYAHGNEPSHHIAYFYALADAPERTAEVVREVFDRFYLPKPDGLCGNEDCGQMSAWYLFSAMGFYPFDPCGGEYVIGAPQVPSVQVKVGGEGEQRTFRVFAKGLSKENKYVKSVMLNGRPITGWRIRHEDIARGGELVFEMGNRGALKWKAK